MPTNDYLPFATGAGSNVVAQSTYAGLSARGTGFVAGQASSAQANKAFRQSSMMAAMLAQFIVNNANEDLLDDGDLAGALAKMTTAFQDFVIATGTSGLGAEATVRANADTALSNALAAEIVVRGAGDTSLSNALQTYITSQRVRLTANKMLYVDAAAGNDSNTGADAGHAYQTIQAAFTYAATMYDLNGFTLTLKLADGTYTKGLTIPSALPGSFSAGTDIFDINGAAVYVVGNVSNPAACVISVTNDDCFKVAQGATLNVSGVQLSATGGSGDYLGTGIGLVAIQGGSIIFGHVLFANCYIHIVSIIHSNVSSNGAPYTIAGNASSHMALSLSSYITTSNSTITVSGTPNVGTFVSATTNSTYYSGIITVVNAGNLSGLKFAVAENGVITTGQGIDYLPGSVAGTQSSGGQYT